MIIRYRLKRSDIWRAYWFPRDRRKLRVAMTVISTVLLVQAILILRDGSPSIASRAAGGGFLFLLAVVGSPVYPLLRFEADERMLKIGPSGVSTTIGKRSGEIAWSKVARIVSEGQGVYIVGKTRNSFAVPFEAFSNDAERTRFIELATQWLTEAQAAKQALAADGGRCDHDAARLKRKR